MSKNDRVLEFLSRSKAAIQFSQEVARKMAEEGNRPDLDTDFIHYADLLVDAGVLTYNNGIYRLSN